MRDKFGAGTQQKNKNVMVWLKINCVCWCLTGRNPLKTPVPRGSSKWKVKNLSSH